MNLNLKLSRKMTINREKLIQLLVEKTNMTKSEVEAQLNELSKRILDAAYRGKALEIKGFGLFYFDEKAELCFKPSEQFDSEINFQYAGMEPVELKPPQRTVPESEAEGSASVDKDSDKTGKEKEKPESEDDVFGIGKTLSASTEDNDDDPPSEPFGRLFQEPSSEIEPQDKDEVKKKGTTPGKKAPKTDQPKKARKKRKRDPMATIMIVIVGVVVLALGYLLISDYLDAPEPDAAETPQQVQAEEPPVSAEQDITEAEEPIEPEQVEEIGPPAEESDVIASDAQQDNYGLYGSYMEISEPEFTIVIHSMRNAGLAESIAEELRQEGYRTSVTQRTVDDRVVYRIGIGQFESVQSAMAEAETLPEPYRNQNFIHRLQ